MFQQTNEVVCYSDPDQWLFIPQAAIVDAAPFERRLDLSCDGCLALCLQRQDRSSPYVCRSLTFDHRWRMCDLYAINAAATLPPPPPLALPIPIPLDTLPPGEVPLLPGPPIQPSAGYIPGGSPIDPEKRIKRQVGEQFFITEWAGRDYFR